jgi:malonyl-CoA/methylmalonyl-CoA synthetase
VRDGEGWPGGPYSPCVAEPTGPGGAGGANPLAATLLPVATSDPSAVAVHDLDDDRTTTYAGLAAWTARLATVVSHLAAPGDRLLVQAPKSVGFLALHLACVRAGVVFVPLNPSYSDDETSYLLDDVAPTVVVTAPEFADRFTGAVDAAHRLTLDASGHGTLADAAARVSDTEADDWRDVGRDLADPAAMLATSGTTGRPKCAVLSQANLLANLTTLTEAWGYQPADSTLHVLPLFHTHGLFVAAYLSLASGGRLLLRRGFDAATTTRDLPAASVFMGVPTHYVRLLDEPSFDATATAGLRLMVSGSAPMTVATHEAVAARTGQVVLERYGMTETGMLTSNPLTGIRKPGTVGPALAGVSVRVADDADHPLPVGDVGAVQVAGANVFTGYWNRPDLATAEFTPDGWFRTGDLGRFDPDGYLELVGRAKELVITGGLNVYPKEVERVLDDLPGVAESAVIGVPDRDFGEAVVAVVVAEPGVELHPDDLRQATRSRLAAYKVPKRVVVVDALPRNAMGKVAKAILRTTIIGRGRG